MQVGGGVHAPAASRRGKLLQQREALFQFLLGRQQRRIPTPAERFDQADAGDEQVLPGGEFPVHAAFPAKRDTQHTPHLALPGPGVASGVQIQLAAESLQAWAQEQEQGAGDEQLTLTPEDLGERITYLATGPASADCDFAVPFGVER